jgi:hypothetical protein
MAHGSPGPAADSDSDSDEQPPRTHALPQGLPQRSSSESEVSPGGAWAKSWSVGGQSARVGQQVQMRKTRSSEDRKRGRGKVYDDLPWLESTSSDMRMPPSLVGLQRGTSNNSTGEELEEPANGWVRLIVTASSWKVLCIVCVTVPLSFMVLLYFGCEPSESADEWGEQQLKDVKTYLQGIRSDHDHVHKLKTDMDYLRRSMQQEEMVCLERAETGFRSCGQEGRESATCTPAAAANCTGQEFSNIFTFQVRELKRAAEHIERLKTRLLEIPSQHPSAVKPFAPAVFDRTTLTCDWNDEDKIVFAERPESEELSGSSTPYHRMSQEHDELRGCHLKIDSISMSSLAHSRGRKGAPHRIVDEAEEDRFGCFRANREPQGCHKYVKRKVDRLRFKAGCASGVREWGWCGRTPFSFLLPDGFPFGNFDDDNRCTTLGDAWTWIWEFLWSWGAFIGLAIYTARQAWSSVTWFLGKVKGLEKILNTTQDDMQYVKAVESGRGGDTHRVSLSLNLVGDPDPQRSPRGSDCKELKVKLRLRTLRETDLRTIVTDPDMRGVFAETAKDTTHDRPFLQDRETKHGEMRNQMVNLFSNHLSSINASNYIMEDMGEQDMVSETYVFGLTYEKTNDKTAKDDHVKKVRVLIIRASCLARSR